jgi:hypothetical protein
VEVNLASLLLRKFWFQINGVARRRVTESWNEEKAVSKRVMMEASREDKIEVWLRSTKKEGTKSGKGTPRKHKSSNQNKGPVPKLFWLSEKPMCSFRGHTEDILDLSWSRSQVCFFRDWILLISQLGLHDMLTQTIFLSRCCVVFAFTPN